LNLSHRTVEEYVQRAMRKMGVNRRMAAVLMWDRENRYCPCCFARRLEQA
jgi:DNA-binding NarL/FixJ family response regulator